MAATLPASLLVAIPAAPLIGSLVAGLFGRKVGRAGAHWVTILGVAVAFALSAYVLYRSRRRRCPLQRDALRMAGRRKSRHVGQPEDGDRLPGRWPDGDDDGGRHLRLADGARLHGRLHGRRPGLPALLQLHLAVHVLDAHARHEQQLPAAFLRLGGGRPGVVPADRLLVHAADGDLRQHEGLHRQPGRRLRLHPGHRPDRGLRRHPQLRRGVHPRPGAGAARLPRHRLAPDHRHVHLPLHRRDGQERAIPAARLAARTRWKARRRSPR